MADWRKHPGSPRYPQEQDGNEEGLSLLRAQYENARNPRLAWCDVKPAENNKVQIIGADVTITLTGEPERIGAIATLICRAIKLGWLMMNELEPGTANEQPPGSPSPAGGNGETKS
jgi:hypothetical protein